MRITPGAGFGSVNTANAVVDSLMYLGDEIQVLATVEGGVPVVVRQSRTGQDGSPDAIRSGDVITISWDSTAPVLLADSLSEPSGAPPPDEDTRAALPQR
jgi:hypothetical protein